jgi:putative salt-induced outer membrane protein
MMKHGALAMFCGIFAAAVTHVSVSHADDAGPMAKGLSASKTATTGSTDVATSTYEAPTKVADEKANDTTAAKISAGALMVSGNSRSMAVTSAGTFRLRRGDNQLSLAAAANYAMARPAGQTAMQKTVENYQGKSRYDRFIAKQVAVFAAVSARKDRFQGLDLRLNLDPGFAYYFVDTKPMQYWTELGYDYQYDLRTQAVLDKANATITNPGDRLSRRQSRHSGRLFMGYNASFNDNVGLTMGVEYLQALAATENWRLLADAGINATLSGKLSISTTLRVQYDHNPLPGIEKTDTIESVSLVYTLL